MELILEFCQNHNGDFDIVKRMLDEAAKVSVKTVKLQCAFAEDLSYRPLFEVGYKSKNFEIKSRPYGTEFSRLKKLELPFSFLESFVRQCEPLGISPLITAFNYSHLNSIHDCGFKGVKIASYDCGSDILIEKCGKLFERVVISTGASYDYEIENAARILSSMGVDFTFLHCVSIYPTPIDLANLERMNFLRKFSRKVGYSDHFGFSKKYDINLLSKIAVFLGADTIERHFTVLSRDESKDGPVSIFSEDAKKLIEFSKMSKDEQKQSLYKSYQDWEVAIGVVTRNLSSEELSNREYYRGRFFNKLGINQLGHPFGRYNWERNIS